jgi:hypothetical protein
MTAADLLAEAVARHQDGAPAAAHALTTHALRAAAGDGSRTVDALLVVGRTNLELGDYHAAADAL